LVLQKIIKKPLDIGSFDHVGIGEPHYF